MKILGITSRMPWPPTDGARICMYHAATALADRGHDLHIVPLEEGNGPHDPGNLAGKVTIHSVPFAPLPRLIGAALRLFDSRPYTQLRKDVPAVYRLLDELVGREKFDAVYADQSHIAQYGAYVKERYGLPYLFRSHNVEHEIWRRHTDTIRNPLMRAYLESQFGKWRRFEIDQMRRADVCAAITERDADTIRRLVPGLIVETIPAAVDLDRFAFSGADEREERSLILLGGMNWAPNRDAAIWFANDILPLIRRQVPDVVCHLVGGDPPRNALPPPSDSFRIEGYVDDILPYYRRVTVGVIPLRVGGGMRVKMVEMLSSGIPIVSTAIGAEGNMAVPGEHYLRADSPEEFAAAVVRLLNDREERRRLSEAGRAFARERYSVEETGRRFEELLLRAVKGSVPKTVSVS